MADPTKKALAVPEARMQFLRLYHGATDELSDAAVPQDRCEEFNQHVAYHREYTAKWFERACNSFEATDGTWATVPAREQTNALRYFGRTIAQHDNRCQFELELLKIKLEKQAEEAAMDELEDLDFG